MSLGIFEAGQAVSLVVAAHSFDTGNLENGTLTGRIFSSSTGSQIGTHFDLQPWDPNGGTETGKYFHIIDTTGYPPGSYYIVVDAVVDAVSAARAYFFEIVKKKIEVDEHGGITTRHITEGSNFVDVDTALNVGGEINTEYLINSNRVHTFQAATTVGSEYFQEEGSWNSHNSNPGQTAMGAFRITASEYDFTHCPLISFYQRATSPDAADENYPCFVYFSYTDSTNYISDQLDFVYRPVSDQYRTYVRNPYPEKEINYIEIWSGGGQTSMSVSVGWLRVYMFHRQVGFPAEAHFPMGIYSEPWRYVGEPGQPAFENDWVNHIAESRNLRFRKHFNGDVQIQGIVKDGIVGPNGTIFTLPDGYIPEGTIAFIGSSEHEPASQAVHDSGEVKVRSGTNAWQFIMVQFPVGW